MKNKYTNENFAEVTKADEVLITQAIDNAHETFHNRKLTVTERYYLLMMATE